LRYRSSASHSPSTTPRRSASSRFRFIFLSYHDGVTQPCAPRNTTRHSVATDSILQRAFARATCAQRAVLARVRVGEERHRRGDQPVGAGRHQQRERELEHQRAQLRVTLLEEGRRDVHVVGTFGRV
jgi:hypothetical protein